MRFALATVTVLAILAAALLVAGCGGGSGSSSSSTAPKKATAPNAPAGSKVVSCSGADQLRATEVGCGTARATMEGWEGSAACALGGGSRGSCSLEGFRCQAVQVDQGISVSCAGPEGDVAFIVKKPAG
jgi:hypothetical protein